MSFTIYPAIDLRGGKVVRLKEGDPARVTAYSDDPGDTARRWLEAGTGWLHIVNLDGAFGESDDANRMALRKILGVANEYDAHIQFGGGLRSIEAVELAFSLGVARVVLGTVAIENPHVVSDALNRFGPARVAVGIDARDGMVRVRGWKEDGGIAANDLAVQMRTLGMRTVIFTDVRRDGLGSGLNIAATRALAEASALDGARALDVIASGGVHTAGDIAAARDANLAGVIIGRALYEGTIDLKAVLESTSPDVG